MQGSLTISDPLVGLDTALEGAGLTCTFEALAAPLDNAKRLTGVLTGFSPTFPGFYLYYPSRHDQPTKLKAVIDFVGRSAR